ncbi:MAG TPA: hypothetical protein VKQ52_11445, partial [Puia sp.]|nr:hypothetical protein [Puia sp.]
MKKIYVLLQNGYLSLASLLAFFLLPGLSGFAQSCPMNGVTSLNAYPNTYYPGTQALVSPGNKSFTVGAVTYGTTPISAGDILLIIQMQGAQISSGNNSNYGDG